MMIVYIIVAFIYCLVGCFVNGLVNEDWQNFSFLLMIFWPMALVFGLFFVALGWAVDAGKFFKDKFDL